MFTHQQQLLEAGVKCQQQPAVNCSLCSQQKKIVKKINTRVFLFIRACQSVLILQILQAIACWQT